MFYKGVEIIDGSYARSYPYARKYSTENERFQLYSKGKLMMFDRYANVKYKFGNRHFWSEGYYVSIVEFNEATIKKDIEEQEKLVLCR